MRLTDADNFEVVSMEGRSEEFSNGVMWMLEQLDNAPTIDAIPRERIEQMKAELHATAEMHNDGDYYLRDEWIDEYFDKYTKEQNNEL